MTQGRAPHGARGLKPDENDGERANLSRAPHGARGLKLLILRERKSKAHRRAPHGARGLKLGTLANGGGRTTVVPRMGRVD